jgi:replicative superfamily II helicase
MFTVNLNFFLYGQHFCIAKIALKGENTIILAGTNAGKTYVAFHIIENHLLKNPDGKY